MKGLWNTGPVVDQSNVAITGGTEKLDDGAAATPSYSFTNSPTTGFYRYGADLLGLATGGIARVGFDSANVGLNLSTVIKWTNSNSDPLTTSVTTLGTDASTSGVLALKNGNNAMEYRIYAGNGGYLSNVKCVTESLTIAAAATTVSATSIPAGAILLGVGVRVTTVIPTAATFTMTTTVGGTTLNTAAVSSAANSTDPGTAAGASYRAAATTVTITPNLTPGTATGVVRLQYYYLQVTPPTS